MPIDVLRGLGLNTMEAEFYELLLPMGDVPMADIIAVTGRHPQVVYRLVDQLVSKGLAVSDTRRHRRYVRAEDPRILERIQAEKLQKLHDALPAFRALQRTPKDVKVRIERGREAVQSLRMRAFEDMVPKSTYYILSASGTDFYTTMGDMFRKSESLRIKRKVQKQMLAFQSQRRFLDEHETLRKGMEVRYLSEEFAVPTSTNIYANTVAIQIWSPDPIVILIESTEVAQSYKDYFAALWKVAKS